MPKWQLALNYCFLMTKCEKINFFEKIMLKNLQDLLQIDTFASEKIAKG